MKRIVIVDEEDNVLGEEDKDRCHEGEGILHRAFLAMIFNKKGEVLLARRSAKKKLWPGFWDGTVASHLSKGETCEQAAIRRLSEEIGVNARPVSYLFKFRYKANYGGIGSENEICALLTAQAEKAELLPNPDEISETCFIRPERLVQAAGACQFTPWFILAIGKMRGIELEKEGRRAGTLS